MPGRHKADNLTDGCGGDGLIRRLGDTQGTTVDLCRLHGHARISRKEAACVYDNARTIVAAQPVQVDTDITDTYTM